MNGDLAEQAGSPGTAGPLWVCSAQRSALPRESSGAETLTEVALCALCALREKPQVQFPSRLAGVRSG